MRTYKRKGLLPINKLDQEHDWQLLGYYNNWQLSLQYIPNDILVGLSTPSINSITVTLSEFRYRKLSIKGDIKTIVETSELLDTDDFNTEIEGTQSYFWRPQTQLKISGSPIILDEGCVYELYFKDSLNNEFLSNIFVAILEDELHLYTESQGAILTEDGEEIIWQA
jgi:hypothetical protein